MFFPFNVHPISVQNRQLFIFIIDPEREKNSDG